MEVSRLVSPQHLTRLSGEEVHPDGSCLDAPIFLNQGIDQGHAQGYLPQRVAPHGIELGPPAVVHAESLRSEYEVEADLPVVKNPSRSIHGSGVQP